MKTAPCLSALALTAAFILTALIGLLSVAAAETPEWVVSTPSVLENTVKDLKANLIIESGGELRMTNATLVMNCSLDGDFTITVKSGGKLITDRSNITYGPNRARYHFRVAGNLELSDSEISGTRGFFESGGLYITGGNSTITRCRFTEHQWYCIVANASAPTIIGCSFENSRAGIRADNGAAPTVSGCTFRGLEREAVMAIGASPVISNNLITDNWRGIALSGSKAQVSGNDITRCGAVGLECADGSDATLSGNNITRCGDAGINVVYSSPKISSNFIFANSYGINITASGPQVSKNTIAGNSGWGIFTRSATPSLEGNKYEDSSGNYNTLGGAAVSWRLTVNVEDSKKAPVRGAEVKIKDRSGKTVYTGQTDETGRVVSVYLQQKHINVSGEVSDTPHKVYVVYGGETSEIEVKMEKDQAITAMLGENGKPFIPGFGLAAVVAAFAAVAFSRRSRK